MSSKNDILYMLEKSRGKYISGQKIATKLNISRNAVWKAITALKDSGHNIQSDIKKGYMLSEDCNRLSAEGISAYLQNDVDVTFLETTDSTNNEAKRRATDFDGKTKLIVANTQTAGRGRAKRSFYSPADTGVYMTVTIAPEFDFSDAVCVTSAAAVSVAKAIENLCDLKPKIKWVNDIYLGDKKVCGILSEAITNMETMELDCIIIGIGINISTTDFPDDIKSVAASIDKTINKNKLCALITDDIINTCKNLSQRTFIKEYKSRSLVLNKEITYTKNNTTYTATAVDIDRNGGLVVKSGKETTTLTGGEINIRLNQNHPLNGWFEQPL